MQKKRRPRYTDEFKKRAVELSKDKGVEIVAKELDISTSSIIRWRAKFGESPVRRAGNSKLTTREMKNLVKYRNFAPAQELPQEPEGVTMETSGKTVSLLGR